jgi:hypothetical protein
MIKAVRGWRMTEATRLIGDPGHNQNIFLDYLPRLKAEGKYRRISRDFVPYRSTRMAPPVVTGNTTSCNQAYHNLEVFESRLDERAHYTMGYPQSPFWRFVGAARNPRNCDDRDLSVSLVDAAGVVQCRSWVTVNVFWHYTSVPHASMVRSPYAFDFSCPMEAGDHFLVTQDRHGGVLETVKVAR